MPNWTQNTFRIEAPKNKIKELKSQFKSKDNVFDFNKIIPMPKNSKKFKAKGNLTSEDLKTGNNWYRWSVSNWGTKWNSKGAEITDESATHIQYIFHTAWDAPRGISHALCEAKLLADCTAVSWHCVHEFESEVEQLIWREKPNENNR